MSSIKIYVISKEIALVWIFYCNSHRFQSEEMSLGYVDDVVLVNVWLLVGEYRLVAAIQDVEENSHESNLIYCAF